jgi:trk system potassium uptake protein TrkA
MRRFLVIGLGRFGSALADALAQAGGETIAVDERMELVEAVKDKVAYAAQLDSMEIESLKAVGAKDVDVAIIAIGEDFEAAVLTTAVLKELGVKEIIARGNTEREKRILELVGATRVISIEAEMGKRLAKALLARSVLEHIELSEGYSMIQWEVDDRFIGKSLAEVGLRSKWGLNLVGIKQRIETASKEGKRQVVERMEPVPRADYVFRKGDVLVLVGQQEDLESFTK